MKVRLREGKEARDTILDFSESQFSSDEIVKQVAQRLHDNQNIHMIALENFELHEKGANALRHAVLGHQSLRKLLLSNLLISSYYACTDDEYYFPEDFDRAVAHLCAILRDARLNYIQLTDLDFRDRTERKFEHFDMVDPATMRDILLQEKEPFYIKEIVYSFNHNPHLLKLNFSTIDLDVSPIVKEIEENIKKRHTSEKINEVLQGTHAAAETHFIPEFFKIITTWAWMKSKTRKK